MKYQVAQHSLRGARPDNQDRVAVAERERSLLLVLADGLGGHKGGDLAAEILVRTAIRAFRTVRSPVIDQPSAFLTLAILQAHKAILDFGRTHRPPIEPRTTCVLCLVQDGYAYWAHVGDSRLYHFRGHQLVSRTRDHSSVEQLRADGVLSEEELPSHPQKARLLKCVGGPRKPTVSLGRETLLQTGDVLLLCSDGLWEALAPEELVRFLSSGPLEEGVEEMVLAANRRMRTASDNISAIGLRWEDRITRSAPLQAPPPAQVAVDAFWEQAKTKAMEGRAKKRPAAPRNKKQTIEAEIAEIEAYLRQFEPKP